MSLQIWLPLNGNLENQGLNSSLFTSSATYDNNGKIGKCLSSNIALSVQDNLISKITLNNQYSFALWMKSKNSSGWAFRFGDINGNTPSNSRGMWINIDGNYEFAYQDSGTNINLASTICDNNWHHIVYSVNDKSAIIYIDGKFVKNLTLAYNQQLNYEYIQLNGNISYINDFRIYDHCLSPKEVKEISNALCLHYQLKGFGQPNLLKGNYYNYKTNSSTNASGSLTLDTNIMPLSSMVGKTFTFSFDYSVEGDRANSGGGMDNRYGMHLCLNYTPSGGSAIQAYPCASYLYMTNTGRAIQTFTVPANCTVNDFSVAIQPTTKPASTNNATWYIRNAKLELGNKATPWCPNSADGLYAALGYNKSIEEDLSGYGYNGSISGTYSFSTDSPHYLTCADFSKSGYIINSSFNVNGKANTISMWVKQKTATTQHFLFGTFTSWTGNGIGFYRDANQAGYNCIYKSTSESSYGSLGTGVIALNTWTHIAFTYNGSTIICYINGVEKSRKTYGSNGDITNPVFMIANSKFNNTPASENEECYICDVRFYATALSAADILELYDAGGSIDSHYNSYTYEYITDDTNEYLNSQGISGISDLEETDENTKWLSTGKIESNNFYEI